MANYDSVPSGASIQVDNFTLSIPDQQFQDFRDLLRLSKLAPRTYENLHADTKEGKFGVSHEWMTKAKEYWLNEYDWRATEKYNNSFPNFIAHVKDDNDEVFEIHFVALFSKKENAIPLLYMHGWPGSHLEHLELFDLYRKKLDVEFWTFSGQKFHACILILIRCCYRIDERSGGYSRNSKSLREEGLFIGLESVMVIVTAYALIIAHPGFVFANGLWRRSVDEEKVAQLAASQNTSRDQTSST